MPRRVSLPAADDLFRPTVVPDPDEKRPVDRAASRPAEPAPPRVVEPAPRDEEPRPATEDTGTGNTGSIGHTGTVGTGRPDAPESGRAPSGRVRHDEKMTVYVTSEELLDLEHARLTLRRSQGLAVDRGRLVREAVAIALADYEANGEDSVLVQRLNRR